MFADAYEIACCFTQPLISCARHFDGEVQCSLASFVVLNPEGWIVTAAHILGPEIKCHEDSKRANEYLARVSAIEQDSNLSKRQKRDKKRALRRDPKWITNHLYLWSKTPAQVKEFIYHPQLDLAIGRLEPFKPEAFKVYPTIKNPENLRPGTSLCKLGFPFYTIQATYDEGKKAFNLSPDPFPIPRFPIEGIYTRNVIRGKTSDGEYEIKFLETSSPGLKGQSGGPVFDTEGRVWGIQVQTTHLALGFNPKIRRGRQEIEENQFLNVGLAVHPEVLVSFLNEHGVAFTLSQD